MTTSGTEGIRNFGGEFGAGPSFIVTLTMAILNLHFAFGGLSFVQ